MATILSKLANPRVPPQNIEAEVSLLGSILLDGNVIDKVVDTLHFDDFYKREHQMIYEGMMELFSKRHPVDVLSVGNFLKERGNLEEVGGSAYLAGLVNGVATPSSAAYYAEIVRKKKILRELIFVSHEISQLGYQENGEVDILLDEAEKRVFSIAQKSLVKGFQPVSGALEKAWERIDRLHKGGGELRGVPTGFKELDNKLSGFQRSDLIVLAARPSLGKIFQ